MAPKGVQFFEDDGGFGAELSRTQNYSQAVLLPNGTIKISGQGGWTKDGKILENLQDQFNLAFENVGTVLKAAGSRGWEDVYLVRAFVVNLDEECMKAIGKTIATYWTTHKPVFTVVGLSNLAIPEMRIEVEVEALKP